MKKSKEDEDEGEKGGRLQKKEKEQTFWVKVIV